MVLSINLGPHDCPASILLAEHLPRLLSSHSEECESSSCGTEEKGERLGGHSDSPSLWPLLSRCCGGWRGKIEKRVTLLIHISEICKQLTMTRERSQSELLPYLHSPKNRTGRRTSPPKQKGWPLCLFQRFLKFSALQAQCGRPFFSNTLDNLPSLCATPHSCSHCTQSSHSTWVISFLLASTQLPGLFILITPASARI